MDATAARPLAVVTGASSGSGSGRPETTKAKVQARQTKPGSGEQS